MPNKGKKTAGLPLLMGLIIIAALSLSLYGGYLAQRIAHQNAYERFSALALQNETGLINLINAYDYALLGGIGFFEGSEFVSRSEWKSYVETIDVIKNFPGINGIGFIEPTTQDKLTDFLKRTREDGAPHFKVHPITQGRPYYVIKYIEPAHINLEAIGLNVGFEDHRQEAAETSRDTAQPAITKKIILVQDDKRTPGFLLFHPVYNSSMPQTSIQDRRDALLGWVYAPFIARNFFKSLVDIQNGNMNLTVYDGKEIDPDRLIYTNAANEKRERKISPKFTILKTIDVMQQSWTLVWESTPKFEQQEYSDTPLFILLTGLLFTILLSVFVFLAKVKNDDINDNTKGAQLYFIPIFICIITSIGSHYTYVTLRATETQYISDRVEQEAKKIRQLISLQVNETFLALLRMANRWEVAKATPEDQWRSDAKYYLSDIAGLTALQWINPDYKVEFVEPLEGNEGAIGLDILFDEKRKKALNGAQENRYITITPPLDLVQGYRAFIAYAPIEIENEFGGFIAGVFSIDDFFKPFAEQDGFNDYGIFLYAEGKEAFYSNSFEQALYEGIFVETEISMYGQKWKLRIVPTKNFVESQRSNQPLVLLICGLVIAGLLSLIVRYSLLSRIKSRRLKSSEQIFRAAMENASIGMALVSLEGKWLRVNKALCNFLGYEENEILKIDFQSITHPDDLGEDLQNIQKIILGQIENYKMEKRYYHKNGYVVWALLSVSMARDTNGKPLYFVSHVQDITERKKIEQMKNEFISVVSHELRTPLTSIRGSLGLIEGKMKDDLPETVQNLVSLAHKNCKRLILLINDILDLDKIAAGKMHFDMKDHSLSHLISQGLEANQAYADKYNITLHADTISSDIFIKVDINRWQQILANLLSNAIKFSPKNGTVIISCADKKDKVRISVIDQGPGIPAEFHDRLFEKFSQQDSTTSRAKGGTGLGLSISKQITEAMQGHIGFDTVVGRGSTFWVEFPMHHIDDKDDIEHIYDEDKSFILHVENDEDFINFIETSLDDDIQVVKSRTLKSAKRKLKQNIYSLVIIDIRLPDGSSLSLIDYIKNNLDYDVPIIIISAEDPPKSVIKQVQASIVKSRVAESYIIETIHDLVANYKGADSNDKNP